MAGEFNPANGQMRVGHETLPGILPAAWHDHLFVSESLSDERETLELESIVNAAQAAEPLLSMFETNGDIEVELDAEGHLPYFVNAQNKNDTTIVVADEVFLHKLAPTEDNAAPNTFQNEVWRDDDFGQLFQGGRVGEISIEFEKRAVGKTTISNIYQRSSQFGDTVVVEDGATPNSSIPQIRGAHRYDILSLSNVGSTAQKLWVKISDITDLGSGTIKARAKIGAGAYGSGTEFDIIGGLDSAGNPRFNEVFLDDGTGAGPRDNPIEIHIQTLTGQEVADEYSWDAQRGVWVASLPDVPVFNTIYTYIYLDDERFCIDAVTLNLTRPVEPQECIGGAYPAGVLERGQRIVTWTINRKYVDTMMRKRLMTGEPVGIRVDCYSGTEFYTGHEHFMSFVSSRVKFGGRTASIESKTEMNEELVGQAFPNPSDGDGNVDDLTIYVKNSIANPNA